MYSILNITNNHMTYTFFPCIWFQIKCTIPIHNTSIFAAKNKTTKRQKNTTENLFLVYLPHVSTKYHKKWISRHIFLIINSILTNCLECQLVLHWVGWCIICCIYIWFNVCYIWLGDCYICIKIDVSCIWIGWDVCWICCWNKYWLICGWNNISFIFSQIKCMLDELLLDHMPEKQLDLYWWWTVFYFFVE